jgi:hypothetical protein
MKRKPVSELTTNELSRQKDLLTAIVMGAGIVLLFTAGAALYMIFQEGLHYMILTLIGCIASIIPGFIGLNEINKEMKLRTVANGKSESFPLH